MNAKTYECLLGVEAFTEHDPLEARQETADDLHNILLVLIHYIVDLGHKAIPYMVKQAI